jgi:hypothetical protein
MLSYQRNDLFKKKSYLESFLFLFNIFYLLSLLVPQQTTTTTSKLDTTTGDNSICSLPPTSTKQPSKLQQMSLRPGSSNTSAPSSIFSRRFKRFFKLN